MAGSLSFDAIFRLLKREPVAPVYYLTGDEDLLKEEVVQWILDKAVDATNRDFNLDVRTAGDLTGEDFHALVETPPMLADRRAVVIRNLEQWRTNSRVWQTVQRYLENPSPSTVLVLMQGPQQKPNQRVAAAAIHVAVEALRPDRLSRWVGMRAERVGLVLTKDAAEHLIHAVGNGLAELAMEIDKLAAAAPADKSAVDADLVADLVGVHRGETLNDWVDAVLARNIPKALDMLDTVLANTGMTGVRMVSALGTALVGVRLARSYIDRGRGTRQIQRDLLSAIRSSRPWGLRGWKQEAEIWARAASVWSTSEIEDALRLAYACDRRLKSTTLSNERAILAEMLLQLVRAEAAA